jgi:hypothetical protein
VTGFSMSIRPSPGSVQSERRTDAEDGVENGSLCLACVFTPGVRERDGSSQRSDSRLFNSRGRGSRQ